MPPGANPRSKGDSLSQAGQQGERTMKPGRHLCDAKRDRPVTSTAADGLKPTVLLCVDDRLDPIAGAGLRDGRGEIVPDGPLGEIELLRDVRDGGPTPGCGERVSLPCGERVRPACERLRSEHGVDDSLPRSHPADRLGELIRRRVLDHEAESTRFHGPPEVARTAKRGKDEDPARRYRGTQSGGRGQAV